ncbi:hypothetical protein LMG3458_02004 [Achromobacter deleyi]|uniref:Acyltransferase 3 domain-containing protein n=1 Tax=Achromobacter deleyi TaxID=1353891 RepID=A0A6S6ZQD0_9BURK|nr:acyltransferase [Achromobacter deleyi]CAB3688476.1 hypothetical protein LMG3458_02004 [Achromobacter deleyi]CAB3870636.1 hypothetical protein LMG3482_02764 [Achromobacter deleyi]CAB3900270.1 hypothetical protein LMG3481_04234 [Achromobacter deleyi]CAB3923077.1 hypothetical protein LMG3412_05483 [Achromobacter deleyi]
MKDQKNFLPWVQALRGITALMVVMVHARLYLRGETGEFVAKTFFYPGAMGVDLFFMLSGFLMVLTTTDSDGSWRYTYRFLYRRVARIWPVYAFTCCLFLALAHYSSAFPLPLSEYRIFIESLLFIPVNPTSPPYFSLPNPVAWTLCFEFYFYVVFALSLCFKNGRWVALSVWFMLTVVAIPMSTGTFNLSVTDNHRYLDFKYANLAVNPIVIEFVLGMLVGKVYLSNVWLPNRYVLLGLTAAAAILIVVLSAAGITTFHGPLGWGGGVFLLFLSIAMLSKVAHLGVPTWSLWLGKISYSLYLTHLFVFKILNMLSQELGWTDGDQLPQWHFWVNPIFALFFAAVVFRYVETPGSAWLNHVLTMRWKAPTLRPQRASL